VVRHDGDDPYLVVAADKGTATFSDIANEISLAYGFWLGDAFASGGSAGYDHKKMGITARGAWESVKLHFRDLGVDIRSQDFTVVGIGDMSGDVFGNGMLLTVRDAALVVGRLRHVADFGRWRRLSPYSQIRPDHAAGPRGAGPVRCRDGDVAAGADQVDPYCSGGPAVERRHRHLRQGEHRVACRRGGQVQ
jgi:hypothetical protein